MEKDSYQILIADDQPDNIFLLEMLLKKDAQYKTFSVSDGKQAVEFIKSNPVDLILMDIMMPVMNGLDATLKIREEYAAEDLPILMITTLSDSANIVSSFEAGANDFVSKPIEWKVLQARISACLRMSEAVKREKFLATRLEKLNQRLKEFSFSVAHDIRNPLAHMRVLCGALRENMVPMVEGIEQIDALAEKAYTFMDNILEHSAYGKASDEKPVCFQKLLEDVIGFLEEKIGREHAQITSDQLPILHGSYSLFFQLILNLVGNAIKYRRMDVPPTITLVGSRQQNEILITIEDNGRGISAEEREQIINPLVRGSSSVGTQGSGLGLSLAKNIIEEYEGTLHIESEPGSFTRIILTFPDKLSRSTI